MILARNIGLRTTLTARNPISPGDLSPRLKKFARSIMLASTDPPVATINKSSNSRIRWCTQSTVFPYEVDGVTLELRRNADIPSQQPVAPKQPEKFSRDRKPKPTGSRFAQPNRFGDVDMDEDEDEEMGSSETEVETPSMTPSETSCETPEKYWSIAAYKPVWDQTFANQGSIGVGLKPNWEPVLETFFPEGLDGFSDTIEKIRQGLADAVESTAAAGIRDQLAAPDVRHLGELGDANSLSEDTVSQSSMLGLPGDTRSVVESNDNGKEEGIVVTSSHETEREYTMAVDGDEDDDDDGAEW